MPAAKPGLLQASGVLTAMILGVTVCNYVFHALASRALGPEDYGSLVSLLAVIAVLGVPSQAIQTVMAGAAALEDACGRHDRLAPLAGKIFLAVGILGAALFVALWAARGYWAGFLHLRSPAPLLAAGAAGVIGLLLPAGRGLLQGLQRFGQLGANLITDALLRLALGALVFGLGWGVTGGLLAGAASGGLALLLALVFLAPLARPACPEPRTPAPLALAGLVREGVPVLAAFGAFAVLSSLDVILVRHYFSPEQAGYYSAASVVGKAFLFLPLAVSQVLFPKARIGHAQAENTRGLLRRGLGLTLAALAAGVGGAWVLAPVIIRTMFGEHFVNAETLRLLRGFGPAIAPLAMTYVLVQYNLAVRHGRFAWLVVAGIPCLLAGLLLWHHSPEQILLVLGACFLLLFGAGYAITPRGEHDAKRGQA